MEISLMYMNLMDTVDTVDTLIIISLYLSISYSFIAIGAISTRVSTKNESIHAGRDLVA